MKKNIFFAFALIFTLNSRLCAESTSLRLELVSFSRVSDNPKNVTAEVCGIVHHENKETSTHPDLIRLILDKDTPSVRVYYTYAGLTGIFCSIVTTIKGTVDAAIENPATSTNKMASVSARLGDL